MSHDPLAGKKLRAAIVTYAIQQEASRSHSMSEAVLDCFVSEEDARDQLRSVLVDSVFRYMLAAAFRIYESPEVDRNDKLFDAALDHFLKRKTRLTGDEVLYFRRVLKNAVLTSFDPRPKSETRQRLSEKQQRFGCYLCGDPIAELASEALEHVWPQNAGGGTGAENLRRAHTECDAAKLDVALAGDTAIGRFAYGGNLPRKLRDRAESWWPMELPDYDAFRQCADDIRSAQLRIAVLLKQEARCYGCKKEFREKEVGTAVLARRNSDEPWWFPNTVALCQSCNKGQ